MIDKGYGMKIVKSDPNLTWNKYLYYKNIL